MTRTTTKIADPGRALAAALALAVAGCAPAARAPAGPPTAPPPSTGTGTATATPTPTPTGTATVRGQDVSDGIRPAAWLLGDWGSGKETMAWVAVDGALYGVRFTGDRFEATMIDDSGQDHGLQLWMYGASGAGGPTPSARVEAEALGFTGDAAPVAVDFVHGTDGLTRTATWAKGDATETVTVAAAAAGARATVLEDADRAFREATHARGPDGWVEWFAPTGVSWGAGPVVTGHDAIKADIAGLLGKASLTWEPSVSRMAPSGTLGFTSGRFSVIAKKRVLTRGSYLTIWQKQADGTWKVAADSGRPEN
jgi:ketosteroid isomerase-like protein